MLKVGLLTRSEDFGQICYDYATDTFSTEVALGSNPYPKSPVGIAWVILGGCNLKCLHCYGNQEELSRTILSTKDCFKICDQIIAAEVMRVVICGGEPMMRSDIFDIIAYLQEGGVSVVLGTNGTYINQKNVYRLANCTRVEVSLDAATREIKNLIRPSRVMGGDAWVETLRAIEYCLEANLNLRMLTALNSYNQTHIVSMAHLLYKMGVRDWALSWTIPAGRARFTYEQLRPDRTVVETGVNNARDLYPDMVIRYSDRINTPHSRFYCLILPDGQMATEDVGLGGKVSFGSLLERNLSEMWNSENFDLEQHLQKWVGNRVTYL